MSNKIIQWNCRWIKANYEELLLLLNKYKPQVVYLQETFLKDKNQLNIKHFQSYNHLYKDGHRASAGVSILVRKDTPQQQININSDCCQININSDCCQNYTSQTSKYIPPYDPINDKKMNKLIEEIPRPHILLGDLNSHNTIWGCLKTNKKGHWSGGGNQ